MKAELRFERIMVANRGEIAARVLAAARSLGLSTVAVYSDADRGAPYLELADSAVRLGRSPSAQSYLNVAALLAAASTTGAEAVHPGYGFLSENGAFARACGEAGLVFVGPPASVIEDMSSKDRARRIAEEAGLSVLAAAEGEDDDELVAAAVGRVGFPALVKAVAGGGGKAMHVVPDEHGLRAALASARREAEAAFGDPRLLVERFVEDGRHVEVQVAGDETGRVVHLFERDCSVQRRHQKVMEEAPAPTLDRVLCDRLCEDAVRLASFVGYRNVGTVEFLVAGGEAHFLEMNTRLQVEHRVTEAVTGVDLVRLQLEIAQGHPMPFDQSDLVCTGHAIEARVYAEDPDAGFLPQAGVPSLVRFSDAALVDAAVSEGRAVTTHYDPMLAKLVVAGPTREEKRRRLVDVLDESAIFGLRTNLGYLRRLAASPAFAEAAIDVNALDREPVPAPPEEAFLAVAVVADLLAGGGSDSPLGADDGWRLGGPAVPATLTLFRDGTEHLAVVDRAAGAVHCDGRRVRVEVLEQTDGRRRYSLDGVEAVVHFALDQDEVTVGYHGSSFRFATRRRATGAGGSTPGGDVVRAPMPGVLRHLGVSPGTRVRAGEILAVLESMKMEFPLRAPRDGVVAELAVAVGDHVGLDGPVARLEALAAEGSPPALPGGQPSR